jgi:hypothetical protein
VQPVRDLTEALLIQGAALGARARRIAEVRPENRDTAEQIVVEVERTLVRLRTEQLDRTALETINHRLSKIAQRLDEIPAGLPDAWEPSAEKKAWRISVHRDNTIGVVNPTKVEVHGPEGVVSAPIDLGLVSDDQVRRLQAYLDKMSDKELAEAFAPLSEAARNAEAIAKTDSARYANQEIEEEAHPVTEVGRAFTIAFSKYVAASTAMVHAFGPLAPVLGAVIGLTPLLADALLFGPMLIDPRAPKKARVFAAVRLLTDAALVVTPYALVASVALSLVNGAFRDDVPERSPEETARDEATARVASQLLGAAPA